MSRFFEKPTDYEYDNYQDYKEDFFTNLPSQVQDDLIKWYNVRKEDLTFADKQRLLRLYNKGCFQAWNCPECGERVFNGTPDNYDHFQGVLNQDFSFFGNPEKYTQEYIESCCDSCRCSM